MEDQKDWKCHLNHDWDGNVTSNPNIETTDIKQNLLCFSRELEDCTEEFKIPLNQITMQQYQMARANDPTVVNMLVESLIIMNLKKENE